MDGKRLQALFEEVRAGRLPVDQAMEELAALPFRLGDGIQVDTHRELRCGFAEAVYAEGKTPRQVADAAEHLAAAHDRLLVTRASREHFAAVQERVAAAEYRETARCVVWRAGAPPPAEGCVAVVTAGTSDLPVAEEAACTLEMLDLRVHRISDVGVAGMHRLLDHLDRLRAADVVVVCAGMEGALPSVLGGLIPAPVVAVPTSVGYGASFGGLAALLAMLNSCAPGIGVVNVDNGFGAGLLAGRILRRVRGL